MSSWEERNKKRKRKAKAKRHKYNVRRRKCIESLKEALCKLKVGDIVIENIGYSMKEVCIKEITEDYIITDKDSYRKSDGNYFIYRYNYKMGYIKPLNFIYTVE